MKGRDRLLIEWVRATIGIPPLYARRPRDIDRFFVGEWIDPCSGYDANGNRRVPRVGDSV